MPSLIDSINVVSQTIDDLLDFVANDEVLSADFEQYLSTLDEPIESEKEFNNTIIEYALDLKMQNGLRVLEYYKRNKKADDDIINALLNSFISVFQVKKVLSNGFSVTCLTSEADLTIVPLVKMNHLKQIGRNDFVEARLLEFNDTQYVLEIYDVISEFDVYKAMTSSIKSMIQNPKSAYYKNQQKKEKIENSVSNFYEKFTQYFKSNYIVTTNKKADDLLAYFNEYRLSGINEDYSELIEHVEKNKYFDVKEYEVDEKAFLSTVMGGFSTQKETYDIALFIDKKRGLYVIPFFETFFKCFEEDIENKNDCIYEFLTNDKVPPSILKMAYDKYNNYFEVVNKTLNTNFNTFEELMFNTKTSYIDEGIYSPMTVLFNSEIFDKMIQIDQPPEEEKTTTVGRNDPCPCGSGLKYKKCCGKLTLKK